MKARDYLLFHEAVSYLGITQGELIEAVATKRLVPLVHYREEIADGVWSSRGVLCVENANTEIVKALGDPEFPLQVNYKIPLFDDESDYKNPIFAENTTLSKLLFYRLDLDLLKPESAKNKLAPELSSDAEKEFASCAFVKNGDYWQITFQGTQLPLMAHRKGMLYVCHLISYPNMTFTGLELTAAISGIWSGDTKYEDIENSFVSPQANKGLEVIDKKTLKEVAVKTERLEQELSACTDPHRKMEIEEELEQLGDYLASSKGLSGRSRFVSSDDKRANDAVKKAIREAISSIKSEDLQKHFLKTIKMKSGIRYESNQSWQIKK